ncbi:MAG: hypothetical protein AAF513_10530 [Pseudomonadota bacterium]
MQIAASQNANDIHKARGEVLSYLLKLDKSIKQQHWDLVGPLTHRLNETLINYIACGHEEFDTSTDADHRFVALHLSTDKAVRFTNRFQCAPPVEWQRLKAHLESLALDLEARFEIEDDLLAQQIH